MPGVPARPGVPGAFVSFGPPLIPAFFPKEREAAYPSP